MDGSTLMIALLYPGRDFTFKSIEVTDDYPARGNELNGKIKWVQIDLEPDDHSHMIDADHMAHVRLVKL